MRIIGLLGGVASGKSFVAEQLQARGAALLDADRTGHEVLRAPEIRERLVAHFGPGILDKGSLDKGALDKGGEIDRKALARLVFAPTPEGASELLYLEQITHPEIRQRLLTKIEQLKASGVAAAVLDAPVMLKSGWNGFCDAIVFVDAPRALREKRAQSRGWSGEEFAARESAQESLEVKRRNADFVIDNSASAEYTQSQIERLWRSLVG